MTGHGLKAMKNFRLKPVLWRRSSETLSRVGRQVGALAGSAVGVPPLGGSSAETFRLRRICLRHDSLRQMEGAETKTRTKAREELPAEPGTLAKIV
jgi:hypothetical protein